MKLSELVEAIHTPKSREELDNTINKVLQRHTIDPYDVSWTVDDNGFELSFWGGNEDADLTKLVDTGDEDNPVAAKMRERGSVKNAKAKKERERLADCVFDLIETFKKKQDEMGIYEIDMQSVIENPGDWGGELIIPMKREMFGTDLDTFDKFMKSREFNLRFHTERDD